MEESTCLFDGVVPGRSVGSVGAGAVAGGTESHFASGTTVSRTCEKIWSEGHGESGSSHRTGRAHQGDESDWRSPDAGRIGRGYAEELEVRAGKFGLDRGAGFRFPAVNPAFAKACRRPDRDSRHDVAANKKGTGESTWVTIRALGVMAVVLSWLWC